MRVGIFGGSFDPIHYGHLLMAETARVDLRLDKLVFVPLGVPPHHKTIRTSGEDRYQMLWRALRPYPEFEISRIELDLEETSYTALTLERLQKKLPSDELFLIMSSETFNDLPNWFRPEEVCRLASLIVAQRAGYPPPDFEALARIVPPERIEEFKGQVILSPLIDISSTMIRNRIAQGRTARFLTPESVIDYINAHCLYQG